MVRATPSHPADLALRDSILAGDRAAAARLFQEHLDSLYEFVHYRLGGDRARTEDIVQEVFVTAFGRMESFDARSSLHTWMCGIAKNKIRAERRARRPRPIADVLHDAEGEIDAILAEVDSQPLPSWILEQEETRELVGATLSSLPPDYRAALLGKYVDGVSVRELSERSGKSEKAQESTLTRARLAFSRVFKTLARDRGELA